MRLSKNEIDFIKKTINSILPSTIYIFGSRLDKNKKGGDLDLYLIPKTDLNKKEKLEKIGLIKLILEERLLLKVDIIISNKNKKEIDFEALKGVKI
ncbi:nucleotidyltransferase domain-containing protein [Caminibacter sp.]